MMLIFRRRQRMIDRALFVKTHKFIDKIPGFAGGLVATILLACPAADGTSAWLPSHHQIAYIAAIIAVFITLLIGFYSIYSIASRRFPIQPGDCVYVRSCFGIASSRRYDLADTVRELELSWAPTIILTIAHVCYETASYYCVESIEQGKIEINKPFP